MSETTLPEMPCQELVELVTDYLEDRLSPVDRIRFEVHIAECEYCATSTGTRPTRSASC